VRVKARGGVTSGALCRDAVICLVEFWLVESGYAIRRTDRDFELASVSRELIEKFSKRTKMIEQNPIWAERLHSDGL
jgi:hypothetical protein